MRKVISLNGDWNFYKGDIEVPRPLERSTTYIQCKTVRKHIGPAAYNYYDANDCNYCGKEMRNIGWRVVQVPHDYIIDQDNEQMQSASNGYLKYENAWYRKSFSLNKEECANKRILLTFDGIATHSEIYLNGALMKRNFSAYNGFEIDITNNVYFEKPNIIAVYVNTDEFEGWWYQGGGIYRDVFLTVTDKTAIDRYGVYAPYKKVDGGFEINFQTTVINTEFENQSVTAVSELVDNEGNTVLSVSAEGVAAKKQKTVLNSVATVKKPKLWNIDTPNLYTIKTTLYKNGEAVDCYEVTTGFRTVELTVNDGLLINGEKTYIYGVNCHQDFGLTGIVMPKNVAYYRTRLFKEMGVNAYRASHYQQTKYIMDSMDELGMVVMAENRWFETTDEAYACVEDLVKRDRNRPSVIFWSTGNEEITHISQLGKQVNRDLMEFIRSLDDTRYITTCEDKSPLESKVFEDCDFISINYNLANYDGVHEMHPEKPFVVTECCATGTTRDWHFPSDNNGRIRDMDMETNSWFQGREKTWKHITERPYIAGAFQWAAVEHRGEAAWPRVCSVSGALDLFLQKKGAFYQNKSHWTTEPMIHIVQHWNFAGLEGEEIPIHIYTNCDEIELFLNGESLGKEKIEKYTRSMWDVKYAAGELKAVGFANGKKVCEHIRQTSGKAAKLKLTPMNDFTNNGSDVAIFTCECLDENGLLVPDACETVTFSANRECEIIGTGSDNCDHTHISANVRKMYMGKITVALKIKANAENIELSAFSDNCTTAHFLKKFN